MLSMAPSAREGSRYYYGKAREIMSHEIKTVKIAFAMLQLKNGTTDYRGGVEGPPHPHLKTQFIKSKYVYYCNTSNVYEPHLCCFVAKI